MGGLGGACTRRKVESDWLVLNVAEYFSNHLPGFTDIPTGICDILYIPRKRQRCNLAIPNIPKILCAIFWIRTDFRLKMLIYDQKRNHSRKHKKSADTLKLVGTQLSHSHKWVSAPPPLPHIRGLPASLFTRLSPRLLSFLYMWHKDTCDFTASDTVKHTRPWQHPQQHSQAVGVRMRSSGPTRFAGLQQCKKSF